MANNHEVPVIPPGGKKVQLADYPADYHGKIEKERALAEMEWLRREVDRLQNLLYADRRYALLIVLQGIDTSGKDGVVNSVFKDAGPIGCSVVSFGVPSEEEKAHDYLWRYKKVLPERGKVVIFNRSHYESVLVERVKGFATKETWEARYEEINDWERYMTAQGTVILKFFLNLSKEEQRRRLQERVDDPKKQWKFRAGDLDDRAKWDDYQRAYEDMLSRCNTKHAPWHVVPADRNWHRDHLVATTLVERLSNLDLRYPAAAAGVAGTVVV